MSKVVPLSGFDVLTKIYEINRQYTRTPDIVDVNGNKCTNVIVDNDKIVLVFNSEQIKEDK